MNTYYLRIARRIFNAYDCCRATRRDYMLQWVKSLRGMGDKALLARRVERLP